MWRKNFFNKHVSNKLINFTNSFLEGRASIHTIGVTSFDYIPCTIQLSNNLDLVINSIIYDTGGIEKYFSLYDSYYKKADSIILLLHI